MNTFTKEFKTHPVSQRTRASGRVGSSQSAPNDLSSGKRTSSRNDIVELYRRLLAIKSQDDSELSRAISYGLQLYGEKTQTMNRKMPFVSNFMPT